MWLIEVESEAVIIQSIFSEIIFFGYMHVISLSNNLKLTHNDGYKLAIA